MPKLILILSLFLAGCGSLSNDDIIKETQKCKEAGMSTITFINGLTSRIIEIQCAPKKDEK